MPSSQELREAREKEELMAQMVQDAKASVTDMVVQAAKSSAQETVAAAQQA